MAAAVRQGFSSMSSSHRTGRRCVRSSGMPLLSMPQHLTLRVWSLVRVSTTCGISPSLEFPLIYEQWHVRQGEKKNKTTINTTAVCDCYC